MVTAMGKAAIPAKMLERIVKKRRAFRPDFRSHFPFLRKQERMEPVVNRKIKRLVRRSSIMNSSRIIVCFEMARFYRMELILSSEEARCSCNRNHGMVGPIRRRKESFLIHFDFKPLV